MNSLDVEVVELGANHGAVARNVGVERARTPYVAFADDDSWWAPQALETAAGVLDAHPRPAVLAGRMLVGEEQQPDPICALMADSPLDRSEDLPDPSVLGFLACGGGPQGGDARKARAARNRLLITLLRRPWPVVVRTVVEDLRAGRADWIAVGQALRVLPRALAARRVVPPEVESQRRLLDDPAGAQAGRSAPPAARDSAASGGPGGSVTAQVVSETPARGRGDCMRALIVSPGVAGSARLAEVPDPPDGDGEVLVETLAIGICGTDLEIVAAEYGEPPPGDGHLVLGHESLGRVTEAPPGSGLAPGDLVVGIVRRPDPVPCPNCAVGEWDMCRNGLYTERGIKGLHGYASERYRVAPEFAVRLDSSLERVGVLLEPTTVVAKAWEHIEHIGQRTHWAPTTVAVTGAGPIGLLAALLGVQRGLDVHVLDIVEEGAKPDLVRDLGATYHTEPIDKIGLEPDIILECSGVPGVVVDVLCATGNVGVVCLTGVSPLGRKVTLDAGAVGREIVLQNDAIFGSVNANRRHYEQAADALLAADRDWLERLITRRVRLEDFADALERREGDVKVVLDFAG